MANHKSALKKSNQDLVRRDRNRAAKSRLRSALKSFRSLLTSDPNGASQKLSDMVSLIDKTTKGGYIHVNAANRLKSKLTLQTTAATA
jgi:small subunit ribosomal protein S20